MYCFFLAMPLKKNKTGMFVYCITDMTVTLIKNPQKIIQFFNFSVQMMYVVNKIDKWKSTI